MSLESEAKFYEGIITDPHYLSYGPAYQEGHLLDYLAQIVAEGGTADEVGVAVDLTADAISRALDAHIEKVREMALDRDRLEALRTAALRLAGSGLDWNTAHLKMARMSYGKE